MLLAHDAVKVAVIWIGIKGNAPWSRSCRLDRLHSPGSPFCLQAPVRSILQSTGHAGAYQGHYHPLIAGTLALQVDQQTVGHSRNAAFVLPTQTDYDG